MVIKSMQSMVNDGNNARSSLVKSRKDQIEPKIIGGSNGTNGLTEGYSFDPTHGYVYQGSSALSPTLLYRRKGSFYILLSLLILGIVLLILIAVGSVIVYITYSQRARTKITIERKDHCLSIGCSFGADCVFDEDGAEPYCRCTHQCDLHSRDYICGNDNITYSSSCHLRLASCQLQTTIHVKHKGPCHIVTNKCSEFDCKYGATCIQIPDKGSDCRCPDKCLEYPEVVSWLREKYSISPSESMAQSNSPVCGLDGRDYENLCQLKKISCLKKKPIPVKYFGQCDPCSTIMCPSNEICQLDSDRRPFCTCNHSCSNMDSPGNNSNSNNQTSPYNGTVTNSVLILCASDGKTYQEECSLQKESCISKIDIRLMSSPSHCIQGNHPCHKLQCHPNAKCNVDSFGLAKCICQTCESIYKPICGSDRVTYDSVCHMMRETCLRKVNLTVSYSGLCDHQEPSSVIGSAVNSSNETKLTGFNSCTPDNCHFGGVCVPEKEYGNHLRGVCQCPKCPEDNDPVCGSNGISYPNDCELRSASCQGQKAIYISHKGPCRSCDKLKCKFYAICEANMYGIYECICPQVCLRVDAPICGSNGVTYDNECELRVRSCLAQTEITIAHLGPCDACQKIVCKNGAQCENGRCVCPSSCPDPVYEPICANDGNTYPNECEMRKNACLNDMDLRSLFYGQCDESEDEQVSSDESGSGFEIKQKQQIEMQYQQQQQQQQLQQKSSNDIPFLLRKSFKFPTDYIVSESVEPCDRMKCNFGGICKFNSRGRPYCECNFECGTMSKYGKVFDEPVCGSDGRVYDNICILKEESCRRQISIKSVNDEQCDFFNN